MGRRADRRGREPRRRCGVGGRRGAAGAGCTGRPAGGRVSGGTYAAGCAAPAPESSDYLSLVPGGPGPRACSRPGVGPGPGRHLRLFLAPLRCKVPGRKTSVVMAVQST